MLSPLEDLSKNTLLARLRRVCEVKKDTGRCKVGPEIHKLWMEFADTAEKRHEMARMLAACNFGVDASILSEAIVYSCT